MTNIIWELEVILIKSLRKCLQEQDILGEVGVYSTVPYKFITPYVKIKSINIVPQALEGIGAIFDITIFTKDRNNKIALAIAQALDENLLSSVVLEDDMFIKWINIVNLGCVVEEIAEHSAWIGNYKVQIVGGVDKGV